MAITFTLTVFAWIFFRANTLTHAIGYIESIFTKQLFRLPEVRPTHVIVLIFVFMSVEWLGRKDDYAIKKMFLDGHRIIRWGFYMLILILIFVFSSTKEQQFIYFQF